MPAPISRTFALATAAAAGFAAGAAAPSTALAQAGATFTYRVQSTAAARQAQGSNAPSPNMVGTVRAAGGNMRMDFREGGMPTAKAGGYVIIRGAERQVVVVNPQERQALVMSADGLGAGTGSLTNNAMLKMTVRDPRFAFEDLGAGERVLGYPTRRVRVRSGSTVEMRVLGRTQRMSDSSTTEYWIAQRPAGLDAAALSAWGHSFGRGLQRTNPELQLQMADFERRFGDGLALRSVAVAYQVDPKGRATVDTVRTEITELARGRVDPSAFVTPAGYQVTDMTQVLSAANAAASAADSARRASGDTTSLGGAMRKAANESVRDNATESVKNAVGGLFRRRKP